MVSRGLYTIVAIIMVLILSACGKSLASGHAALTPKSAVELAAAWSATEDTILAGGTYKEGEYSVFTYKGSNYRYLSEQLDTKKKLKAELQKFVTKKKAKRFLKDHNIVKHKGKLAQPELEVGSMLQWDSATARELRSKRDKMTFELTVPIGDTRTAEKMTVHYRYEKKKGWRIHKFNE